MNQDRRNNLRGWFEDIGVLYFLAIGLVMAAGLVWWITADPIN